ncbi:MAG: hypothetical protein PVJ61_00855 [Dehalococcoidia bacterium]|jgi:hypothetical protein
MKKEALPPIEELLGKGEEDAIYKEVTAQILKEESETLQVIPKQADNWNALAHQVVGSRHIGDS